MEATGPPGTACVAPASVEAVLNPVKFWTAPALTMTNAAITDSGTKTRTRLLVRSAQKLPIVRL